MVNAVEMNTTSTQENFPAQKSTLFKENDWFQVWVRNKMNLEYILIPESMKLPKLHCYVKGLRYIE